MDSSDSRPEKRNYEAPKVKVISLRPEEAVLGNCKSGSHTGPVGTNCTLGPCTTPGS